MAICSQGRTPGRNAVTLKDVGCVRCVVYSSKNADPWGSQPSFQYTKKQHHAESQKDPPADNITTSEVLFAIWERRAGEHATGCHQRRAGSALSKGGHWSLSLQRRVVTRRNRWWDGAVTVIYKEAVEGDSCVSTKRECWVANGRGRWLMMNRFRKSHDGVEASAIVESHVMLKVRQPNPFWVHAERKEFRDPLAVRYNSKGQRDDKFNKHRMLEYHM